MRYETDINGYITCVFWGCNSGKCKEYTGAIPTGYSSLAEWEANAIINAYYINGSGNLVLDAGREADLKAEAIRQAAENVPVLRKDLFAAELALETQYVKAVATGMPLELRDAKSLAPTITLTGISPGVLNIFAQSKNMLKYNMKDQTISEMQFKKQKDGTVLLKGTAIGEIEYTIAGSNDNTVPLFALVKEKDYHFSFSGIDSYFSNVSIEFRYNNGETIEPVYIGSSGSINIPETREVTHVVIKIPSLTGYNNVSLKPRLYYGEAEDVSIDSEVKIASIDLRGYYIGSNATLIISKGLAVLEMGDTRHIVSSGNISLLNGYNLVYTNQDCNMEIEYYKNFIDVESLEFLQGKNTTNDRFKILEDGSISSKAGFIGGWNITEEGLWRYIVPPNEEIFTEADAKKVARYIVGVETLTDEELVKYDLNGDSKITSVDVLMIQQFAKTNMSKNAPGKLVLNTNNWKDPIKIIDSEGNTVASFGVYGVSPGPADYIIDEGMSGEWRYQKWRDGKCEIWGSPALTFPETTELRPYSHRSIVQLDLSEFFIEVISGDCGFMNTDIMPKVVRHGTNKHVAEVVYNITAKQASFTDRIPLKIVGMWK